MESFFSLKRATPPPIAVSGALSYLFNTMSHLYLCLILERGYLLLVDSIDL